MKISTAFVAALALAATTTFAAADSKIKAEVAQPTITVSSQSLPILGGLGGLGAGAIVAGVVVTAVIVNAVNNSSGSH